MTNLTLTYAQKVKKIYEEIQGHQEIVDIGPDGAIYGKIIRIGDVLAYLTKNIISIYFDEYAVISDRIDVITEAIPTNPGAERYRIIDSTISFIDDATQKKL